MLHNLVSAKHEREPVVEEEIGEVTPEVINMTLATFTECAKTHNMANTIIEPCTNMLELTIQHRV